MLQRIKDGASSREIAEILGDGSRNSTSTGTEHPIPREVSNVSVWAEQAQSGHVHIAPAPNNTHQAAWPEGIDPAYFSGTKTSQLQSGLQTFEDGSFSAAQPLVMWQDCNTWHPSLQPGEARNELLVGRKSEYNPLITRAESCYTCVQHFI